MSRHAAKTPPPPLNNERLRGLALHYVGKYATTRAKLANYLQRKINERGWDDASGPETEALIERLCELGYINDAQFAEARSRALVRRGFGRRRLDDDLRSAGIDVQDAQLAREFAELSDFESAENFARRKRIGPFANEPATPERKHKQLQAFLRAGHSFDLAKRFVNAEPEEQVDAN
jgi:regulatory protein